MSVTDPNGALVAIEAASGTAVVVTAISNASPAVATVASHTYSVGDIVEVVSGWSRLTNKIVRIAAQTATTLTLEGIDTTSTTVYPVGGGAGTAAKVTSFTQLAQILNSTSSGGEQQFLEYQFLESDSQKRIPTFKNAAGLTFTVGDDPSLPGYQLASIANDDRLPRAIQITLPTGSKIYYNGYISLNKTPSLTVNELMAVEVTVSLLNEPTRYAS